MGRNNTAKLPVIIGMNPPTKEVVMVRTIKPLKGYACMIYHADFPEGTKSGDFYGVRDQKVKRYGLASWLHFTNADAMHSFGENLMRYAEDMKKLEREAK